MNVNQNRKLMRARTVEACSKHYTMAWPHEEHESGRPRFLSPLYERLKARRWEGRSALQTKIHGR